MKYSFNLHLENQPLKVCKSCVILKTFKLGWDIGLQRRVFVYVCVRILSPQYAAEHHEMSGHIGGVQHGWSIRPHAGQESPYAPVLVLHGLAQPQLLQVGAGPLAEGKSLHQLGGVWRFTLVGCPLFYNNRLICD